MAAQELSRYVPSGRARRLAVAVIIALTIGVAFVTVSGRDGEAPGGRLGGDLPAFYGAGSIAADGDWDTLYEPERQIAAQRGLWENDGSYLYFAYPPQVAALYRPLVPLGYRGAYAVHTALMAVVLLAAVALARPLLPRLGRSIVVPFAFALTFWPMLRAITGGQNSALTLLLFVAVARLEHEERSLAAGLVAAAALYKPQFGVPLALFILLARQWRMLAGWAAGAAVFAGIGVILAGAGWPGRWLAQAADFRELNVAANGENFISIGGVLEQALGAGDAVAVTVGATLALVGIGLASVVWVRFPDDPLLRSAAAAAAIVAISPQPLFYEAGVLLLVVGLLWGGGRSWSPLGAGAVWASGLMHLLAPVLGFSPLVILPVALGAIIAAESGEMPRWRTSPV